MSEVEVFKTVLDLGGQGVLLFLLYKVWERLTTVTDILIEDKRKAEAQRQEIMRAVNVPKERRGGETREE